MASVLKFDCTINYHAYLLIHNNIPFLGPPLYAMGLLEYWGSKQVFGKTEDSGLYSVKQEMAQFLAEEMKTKYLSDFAHVNTEECRPAKSINIKCEDCKFYLGWLAPNLQMCTQLFPVGTEFL